MNRKLAELLCMALYWIGSAGVIASTFITNSASARVECLCEFAAVIIVSCIAKLTLARLDNDRAQPGLA